ncbi:MAG: hypothetical protein FJ087_23775 [Deltaproteobacteria bacterium]|nr:hypothetical protein [Deltaproteobacteria bacterium]
MRKTNALLAAAVALALSAGCSREADEAPFIPYYCQYWAVGGTKAKPGATKADTLARCQQYFENSAITGGGPATITPQDATTETEEDATP